MLRRFVPVDAYRIHGTGWLLRGWLAPRLMSESVEHRCLILADGVAIWRAGGIELYPLPEPSHVAANSNERSSVPDVAPWIISVYTDVLSAAVTINPWVSHC